MDLAGDEKGQDLLGGEWDRERVLPGLETVGGKKETVAPKKRPFLGDYSLSVEIV